MKEYLLLRDNKESGPYSLEDLKNMGFKPYDLVWHEGKSAAWRYPGELPEFSAFAPVVEEQPYDRFFRKQESEILQLKEENLSPENQNLKRPEISDAILPASSGIDAKPEISSKSPTVKSGKIVVTMPAARAETKPPSQVSIEADQSFNDASDLNPKQEPVKRNVEAAGPTVSLNDRFARDLPSPERNPESEIRYKSRTLVPTTGSSKFWQLIAAASLLLALFTGYLYFSKETNADTKDMRALLAETNSSENAVPAASLQYDSQTERPLSNDNFFLPEENSVDSDEKDKVVTVREAPKEISQATTLDATPKKADSTPSQLKLKTSGDEAISREEEKTAAATEEIPKAVKSADLHRSLIRQIDLKNNDFKIGALGGISKLALTLANNSEYELSRVEVELSYLSPEKRVVRSQILYFDQVGPGETATVEVPKSSRGVDIKYEVKKLRSPQLDMANNKGD